MKKYLILIFCILIILMLVCCKSNNKVDEKENIDKLYDENMDLYFFRWYLTPISSNDEVIKYISEKFNVNLKFEVLPWNKYAESLGVKIAAGDIPDLYGVNKIDLYSYLLNDRRLVEISKYADELNLMNLKTHISVPEMGIFWEDDGLYRLPAHNGTIGHTIFVRQDWLEKLNLSMPKTMDDFKNMVCAFVENDLDGQNNVGIAGKDGHIINHLTIPFTGINGRGKVDGVWMTDYMHPNYKEAIEFIASMYKEGLIDKELYTQKAEQAYEKMATGRIGVLIGTLSHYNLIENPLLEYNENAKLATITPWPEGPAGTPRYQTHPYYGQSVINADIKKAKKERILYILDWMLSSDGEEILWNGIRDVHYNIKDGTKIINEDNKKRDFSNLPHHCLSYFVDISKYIEYYPEDYLYKDALDELENGIIDYSFLFTSSKAEPINSKLNEIRKKWDMKFITGEANIDQKWEEFIYEINQAGYDEYIKELSDYMESKGK